MAMEIDRLVIVVGVDVGFVVDALVDCGCSLHGSELGWRPVVRDHGCGGGSGARRQGYGGNRGTARACGGAQSWWGGRGGCGGCGVGLVRGQATRLAQGLLRAYDGRDVGACIGRARPIDGTNAQAGDRYGGLYVCHRRLSGLRRPGGDWVSCGFGGGGRGGSSSGGG